MTAIFRWAKLDKDTPDTRYAVYVIGETLRTATVYFNLRYSGVWTYRIRETYNHIPTPFTDSDEPPKEYIESMLLLSVDIKHV